MKTIYKYPFLVEDEFPIQMPKGAEILHVASQGPQPCIWALVDTSEDPEYRYFRVFGTGHSMDSDAELFYVGTFPQGPFVWHLFELLKGRPR